MSIAQRALAEAPIADANDTTAKTKSPPRRQLTALKDTTLVAEVR